MKNEQVKLKIEIKQNIIHIFFINNILIHQLHPGKDLKNNFNE